MKKISTSVKVPAANKLFKYSFMRKSNQLAPHLPETHKLTPISFENMIKKYGSVIVKPINSRGGFGVIQVTPWKNHYFQIHIETSKTLVYGLETAYRDIQKLIGTRKYIIQRRIPLPKINDRPFDMRIIVQRKKNSNVWAVTGRAAKVAGKGYFVTNNTRSKGKMLPVETAIQASTLRNFSSKALLSKIKHVALLSAKRLQSLFPHHRIYGLDIGFDQHGHVWIIEANLFPALSHFRKLGDMNMYRRIIVYR
ncbi:YheC/YheD family protein [Shimazuella kribbensis]|uniref:YheC/YheD family protein n=1 Tax=Shimazuella kribbensis TaxID=139808 RepID=UPI0003FA769F|nr:YheC/YheD family protein [Shimazuella kribbensis]